MARPAADAIARIRGKPGWASAPIIARMPGGVILQDPAQPRRYNLRTGTGNFGWHVGNTSTEVDTSWTTATGEFQWRMVQADYHVFARSVINAGDTIEYRHPATNHWVRFQPLSINWINQDNSRQQIATTGSITGAVSDDRLTWTNAYGTGRHFRFHTQIGQLQKLITIDSAANLPTPTVSGTVWFEAEFVLKNSTGIELYLDGTAWARTNNVRVRTGNRIEFKTSAGATPLFWLDYARAWDSAGNSTIGQFEVRRQSTQHFVTVRIPKTWIDAATFPIFIDPSVSPQVGQAEHNARQNHTQTNWSLTDLKTVRAGPSGNRYDAGFIFTITGPNEGDTVTECTIDVWNNAGSGRGSDVDVNIHFEDTDYAVDFDNVVNFDLIPRVNSAASSAWAETLTASVFNTSPDITAAAQVPISKQGWFSGNQAAVLFRSPSGGNASCGYEDWTTNSTNAAILDLTWLSAVDLEIIFRFSPPGPHWQQGVKIVDWD